MADRQICPWCDTEIVWDEEIGPEETCPYCENELGDYKSVIYGLDDLEDEDVADVSDVEDEPSGIEDYGEMAGAYSDESARGSECTYCGEETIIVGQKLMSEAEFIPRTFAESKRALIEAPFTMDVGMCPSCLQMSFSLSEDSRKQMEERWKREVDN